MRIFFIFLFTVLFTSYGFSQFETSKKVIRVVPIKKKDAPKEEKVSEKVTPAEIKYESSLLKENNDNLLRGFTLLPKKEEKGIMEKEVIRNSSEIYTERANKKSGDGEVGPRFKSDTFLGEFKSGTKIIRISCRDHEYPDGDLVRIWLNDKVAVNSILLDVSFSEVYLDLNEGFNKIEIEALNQGSSGPNTAQFTIVDETGKMITNNKWNLTTGVKAKIIVTKMKDVLKKGE